MLKIAQKYNPKIGAYMEDIKAASAVKKQARSAYSPTIDIEAGHSYSVRGRKEPLWEKDDSVALVGRWNLFNSFADVEENKAQAARVRQSRRILYDYYDELKLSVENSWTELLSAQRELKFYREAIEYNRSTRDAYIEQFDMGERSLLDVLDAENELYNSSTQAATAYGNTLIASFRLKALASSLLPSFDINPGILKFAPEDHEPLEHLTPPK